MKIRKKKETAEAASPMNTGIVSGNGTIEKRHLKTNYPVSEQRIGQLAARKGRLVPCTITSEDDYYVFSYDTEGLRSFEFVRNSCLADRYAFLIHAGELEELVATYSFSLDPENLLTDVAFRPFVTDRGFSAGSDDFLAEYKALAGAVLDREHSFDDFLRGGKDLFGQSDVLAGVLAAKSVREVQHEIARAAEAERSRTEESYVTVEKGKAERQRILLPIFCIVMILAIGFSGYEFFVKDRANEKVMNATEQYFADDYSSVGKTLESFDEKELSDATRYIAAVSAVKSSGLTSEQKSNVLKAIDRYGSNKDYLNYWVMIGRGDYAAADDYAQKFGDDEHRAFALAQQKSQVSKDPSLSGSEKTEMINKLDEEIEKLIEAINEDKYGIADGVSRGGNDKTSGKKTNAKKDTDESTLLD